jgi:hypothetical protein
VRQPQPKATFSTSPGVTFGGLRGFKRSTLQLVPPVPIFGCLVTGTISVTCVLIVYDGWANVRYRDAVAVILGPVIAIVLSHMYSGGLMKAMDLQRRLNWTEWRTVLRFKSRFLLLAAPPLLILTILWLVGVSHTRSIRVTITFEALSLSVLAGVVAYRAGFRGWRLSGAILLGLLLAAILLGFQAFLQPGRAEPY